MTPAYVKKLGFQTRKTDVGVLKIDRSSLTTYIIVIAKLQFSDKIDNAHFFRRPFYWPTLMLVLFWKCSS